MGEFCQSPWGFSQAYKGKRIKGGVSDPLSESELWREPRGRWQVPSPERAPGASEGRPPSSWGVGLLWTSSKTSAGERRESVTNIQVHNRHMRNLLWYISPLCLRLFPPAHTVSFMLQKPAQIMGTWVFCFCSLKSILCVIMSLSFFLIAPWFSNICEP